VGVAMYVEPESGLYCVMTIAKSVTRSSMKLLPRVLKFSTAVFSSFVNCSMSKS